MNDTKGDSVSSFLDKIGPRPLTAEEARQLHLLKLKEGIASNSHVAEKIAGNADEGKKTN